MDSKVLLMTSKENEESSEHCKLWNFLLSCCFTAFNTGERSETESPYKKNKVATKKRTKNAEVEPDGTTTFKAYTYCF